MINMAIKIDVKKFEELLQIQQERQLAMQELSEKLGIDISFNDEEVLKYAMEEYSNYISNEINREVEDWMKSLFL